MKRTLAAWAIAAVMAFAIAGCGSDEGDGSAARGGGEGDAATLSKAEFVERANAACKRAQDGAFAKTEAYRKRHASEGLAEDVLTRRALNAALVSTVAAEVEALRELAPAAEGQAQFEAVLAEQEAALRRARKRAKTATLEQMTALLVGGTNEEFRSLGLRKCVLRV